ncbi:unnamed protein product [Rhodiola kirilowii]
MEAQGLSRATAVTSCSALASLYVAILYAPTVLLRLPPPANFRIYMIRRFICASICSFVSIVFTAIILPTKGWDLSYLLKVYGLRSDHVWQAVVFPIFLTSLVYSGSLLLKSLKLMDEWKEANTRGESIIQHLYQQFHSWIFATASNIIAWRNYVVAPLTEELVFRACIIPLLLCGGFSSFTSMFLGPIFFSLAHLNHLMEIYSQGDCTIIKAFTIVGFQLCYTVLFGSFASFIFIRTGHLIAPIGAHILCNFMGFPVLYSRRNGLVTVAFLAGVASFAWLLFPLTRPDLYRDRVENCCCWHGYCG